MFISILFRKVLVFPIKIYKKIISPMLPRTCKYYPTCSSYAITSIERFGIIKGLIMAFWRLLRCNPFSNGGVDYVPEKFGIYLLKHRKK